MPRARSRNVVRLSPLPLLAVSLGFAGGCAALFGMDSGTCLDCEPDVAAAPLQGNDAPSASAAPDAGADAAAAPRPEPAPGDPCEAYCGLMTDTCGDSTLVPDRPYMNRAACLALCRHIPPGAPGDTSGNSLACRSSLLQSAEAQNEPALVCAAAGRGGQAGMTPVCGSNCDAYCALLTAVCADRLPALDADCLAACAQVPDRFAFDIGTDRAGDTVQCRLWHVGVASECTTEECRVRHCGHAVGIEDCVPQP